MRRAALWPAIVAASALVAFARRSFCVDDGFIFARIARTILDTGVWGYNPGAAVSAATSPLMVLLLLPLEAHGLVRVETFAALSAAALAAAAIAALRLLEPVGRGWALVGAGLVLTLPHAWRSIGLESSVLALLVIAASLAHARRRPLVRGAALGLAVLARPDAALLAAAVLALDLRAGRSGAPGRVAGWAIAAAIVAPWLAFSWLTFGSPVPDTLAAKLAQADVGWWRLQPPFAIAAIRSLPWWPLALLLSVVAFAPRREPDRALFGEGAEAVGLPLAFGVLQTAAYELLGVPAGYPWHALPLALGTAVATAIGLRRLAGSEPRGGRLRACATAGVLVLLHQAWGVARLPRAYRQSEEYRAAAAIVRESAGEGCLLAATEIGYLGYYSGCAMLDIHALVHPEAIPAIRRGEALWWYARSPRWIVTHDPPWYGEPNAPPGTGPAAPEFAATYEERGRFGAPGSAVVLWERREGALRPLRSGA